MYNVVLCQLVTNVFFHTFLFKKKNEKTMLMKKSRDLLWLKCHYKITYCTKNISDFVNLILEISSVILNSVLYDENNSNILGTDILNFQK